MFSSGCYKLLKLKHHAWNWQKTYLTYIFPLQCWPMESSLSLVTQFFASKYCTYSQQRRGEWIPGNQDCHAWYVSMTSDQMLFTDWKKHKPFWWTHINLKFCCFFFLIFCVYLLWGRERQSTSRRVERERETWNLKQVPGSELPAQIPTQGPNPRMMRSWPEPKSDA